MKKALLIIFFLIISIVGHCQNKKLSVDSLMNNTLFPKSPKNIQFISPSTFAYILDNDLYLGNSSIQKSILTLTRLNSALKKNNLDTVAAFPSIHFITQDTFIFNLRNKIITFSVPEEMPIVYAEIDHHATQLDIFYPSLQYSYSIDNNLYIYSKGVHQSLSNESNKEIIYGQPAHRNEFSIEKGTFWSPKGNLLAFYRMDETMVTDYPLIDVNTRIASVNPVKYPMAGMKSHEVTVGIYNTGSKQTIYLETQKDTSIEEREMYLTNLTWHPNEQSLFIAKVNRAQNHMWLESYDATTGKKNCTLFEEQSTTYVEPLSGMFFLPNASAHFIWLSQRDGFRHFYLYNEKGDLIKQVTSGNWAVKEWVGFDKDGKNLFFYANKDNPLETALYRVNIHSGKIDRITQEKGSHKVVMNDDRNLILTTCSNRETPSKTTLINIKGKPIVKVHESENPLNEFVQAEIEIGKIKAGDQETDVYYRIYKPVNRKEGQKYPALVYVYGGPHSQLITESWLGGGNLFFMFLAQEGYVVFTLENRGTSNRGFAFESVTHQRLGEIEMQDQIKGVEFLKSLPYVDSKRIGVDGWSYGGFMSLSLKLNFPEIFKMATAGGPVIDWKWYEIMYGERYMGHPDKNKEGYQKNALLNKIPNLCGKVMIIHGAQDPTVVWQHSLAFLAEAIRQKKQIDYFVYPLHEHNVRGKDRVHLYRKLYEYYEQNLKMTL